MRLYLRAALTICRPSQTFSETGFSTYTSFPAWHAQTAASACQWLQVEITTALMSLLSSTFRRSISALASGNLALLTATCEESASQTEAIRTSFTPLNHFTEADPRSPTP